MTAEELIKRLNKNERIHAKKESHRITVCNDTGHILFIFGDKATNFLDFIFNDQLPSDSIGKSSREFITAQIEEYLQTPIEKRKSEKKYAIAWASDDDGTENYLCKRDGNWCICKRRYGDFPNGALFTQKELDDLKKCNFALIDVLDKLKTRV